jgi:hypothetical protein
MNELLCVLPLAGCGVVGVGAVAFVALLFKLAYLQTDEQIAAEAERVLGKHGRRGWGGR